MKIVSWNVWGLRGREKRRKIKEFLLSHSPDIVLVQETKLQDIEAFDVYPFGVLDARTGFSSHLVGLQGVPSSFGIPESPPKWRPSTVISPSRFF